MAGSKRCLAGTMRVAQWLTTNIPSLVAIALPTVLCLVLAMLLSFYMHRASPESVRSKALDMIHDHMGEFNDLMTASKTNQAAALYAEMAVAGKLLTVYPEGRVPTSPTDLERYALELFEPGAPREAYQTLLQMKYPEWKPTQASEGTTHTP